MPLNLSFALPVWFYDASPARVPVNQKVEPRFEHTRLNWIIDLAGKDLSPCMVHHLH
jgi:hypothetical protein